MKLSTTLCFTNAPLGRRQLQCHLHLLYSREAWVMQLLAQSNVVNTNSLTLS
jgi:hypothetical protein